MTTVIKRYQNRKLYDVEQSRYVTIEDLARMIREGQTVQVIDHETDDDISTQILANILKQTDMSAGLLHHMIRFGAISELQDDVRQLELEDLELKIETLEQLVSQLVSVQETNEP